MRLRMPKLPTNLASQTTDKIEITTPLVLQPIISTPITNTSQKLQIPTTSASREALQKIPPRTCERSKNEFKIIQT